jgi:hypothetical protein
MMTKLRFLPKMAAKIIRIVVDCDEREIIEADRPNQKVV